ncbi:ABC transporter permease [Amycolatopsis anabasis]|uniref:ABC transporter permease n=1 Tax=Amycolatopsis anabasis TaxID=1840409 RepID=UPI00131C1EAE|nr:ABC transporter permease [Amycolatopsis anabasis]
MPEHVPRERALGWGLRCWVAGVAILLLAPTLVVIPMSFGAGQTFEFPPREWSLRWYREFFESPEWMASLVTSVQVGLLTAVLATVLGVAAAIGLDRARFRGKEILRSAMMAPMIVPGIVVAVAIYAAFLRWQLNGTLFGFVLAHTVLAVPFVVTAVGASLAGYDRTVETAAASLGASWWAITWRVTLPLLAPGVASGFVFAFVTSLDEVVIALFLQTPDIRTLPVQMYDSITLEIDPTIAAASSLIVVVTTLALLIPQFVRRRRSET